MPLTLVTGPANSAKARVVLERFRAELARGPILVVPTAADAVHYRRELAGTGVVLGARVESFAGLMREIVGRAEPGQRALGPGARERVVGAAIAEAPLELLRPSSAAPGFLADATRLVAELGARRIDPQRLTAALRSWAPSGPRRRYCDEVAAIYAGYRRRLERLGRVDAEQLQARALDALRIDPSGWGRTPVLLYGFDDLDPLQLDAVETLARHVAVVVSLPYEAGRVALAGRAATFETLRPSADEVIVLPPRAEHYEDAALHRLERALFAEATVAGGPAVGLIEGETEREELELVGEEIRELLADGYRAEDIAVVMRSVAGSHALIAEVFGEQGIPVSLSPSLRFADTAVGRGLLGLLRTALAEGEVDDLLAWLRAPGVLDRPGLADRFEARLRRRGVRRAAAAVELWEHFPLDAIERLRTAAGRGPGALLERTAVELDRLLAAPWRRRAYVLDERELGQARVAAAAAGRLAELRELTAADRTLGPSPAELIATLAGLGLEPLGAPTVDADTARVLVCDALALRARRVRALFVCGLVEGAFPAPARERPFFGAEERADIARASGLRLGPFEDVAAAERYLFYATVSRARSRLRLSWHRAADDGSPRFASGFVDDVRDTFFPAPETRRRGPEWKILEQLRVAGGVPRGSGGAPLGHLQAADVLGQLGERAAESPSTLEAWTACPVNWFVERLLGARPLEPDSEPMARGNVAHAVLARVVAELCAGDDPAIGDLVRSAVAEHAGAVSTNPERDRAERRRLEADLERYLEGVGGAEHVPEEFELAFGLPGSDHPAVALAGGELVVKGRIDRVDVDRARGTAIVHDYKSGEVLPAAKWEERGRLALALYMLAAGELLGVSVVGGLYQPLRGNDLRPRGALLEDVERELACFTTDRIGAEELETVLGGALERALAAARELRSGALEPRPATCTRGGVCRHPAICRATPRAAA